MIYKILKEELGYDLPSDLSDYNENHVSSWKQWWKGNVDNFHEYSVSDGKKSIRIHRKKLGMAKTVCEDWANLLLNDKTYILVNSSNESVTEETQKFLAGNENEQNDGVLGNSKFWKNGNRSVEKAFALGTGCFYLTIVNPKIKGEKVTGEDIRIKYIKDVSKIIPLSWDEEGVSEIALVSIKNKKGQRYYYFQLFLKEENGYKIENHYFKIKLDNEVEKVKASEFNVVEWYKLPCKPFFLLSPNIENNINEDFPLGLSIYANAIDQLEGCDMAFDNFMSDVRLGKKKIFMDQSMIALSNGKPDGNSTMEQTLFVKTGERLPGAEPHYQEYNPNLRSDDNEKNIQIALNLLSSKVGLGKQRYSFKRDQNAATATEVKISNKDLTESIWKQRIQIQELLEDMTRSILILGREICNKPIDPNASITINFDDSMFTDEESQRMRFLQEISAGVRQKWEYRVKYLGEDEETAKEMTKVSEKSSFQFTEGQFN